MLPVVAGQFQSLQSDAVRWPVGLKQAAALCTSLTLITKSKVVGELDERRAFHAVEARFLVGANVCGCCKTAAEEVLGGVGWGGLTRGG